jgi:hypothetical protein
VRLKFVKQFVKSARDPVGAGGHSGSRHVSRSPAQSDDELMNSLLIRQPEPGKPKLAEADDLGPSVSNSPRNSGPVSFNKPPVYATGRQFRAVTESPAEQKLIEQLQSRESAAAELAMMVRTLQVSGPGERNQPAIDDSQRELQRQLGLAFDLKLQLEELQVQELQSRLSRLERQIGQRRALRDKIIARRAAQLVEDNGLQWDTSGPSPQRPLPRRVSNERQPPTPAASPAVVKKLQRRTALLIEGMHAGEVKPAIVLSALQDLARVDPDPHVDWWQALLDRTRKLHDARQIAEPEFLEIAAACEAYEAAKPTNESGGHSESADDDPRAKADRVPKRPSGVTQTTTPAESAAIAKKLQRRTSLLIEGMLAGEVKPAAVLSALQELKQIEPPPDDEWLQLLQNLLEDTRKLHRAGRITQADRLPIEAAFEEATATNESAGPPGKVDASPAKAVLGSTEPGWTQIGLNGPQEMQISFAAEQDLETEGTYLSIKREAGKVRRVPVRIRSVPGSSLSIAGQLAIYPTDSNDPEADVYLQKNVLLFPITEQDARKVAAGDDVTKVVVMSFEMSLPGGKVEKIDLGMLDSSKYPPGTNLIDEAPRHGSIVAVLTLSRPILSKESAEGTDPPKSADGDSDAPKRVPVTEKDDSER